MNWRGGEKNIESSDGTAALKSHKLKVDTRKGLLIRINPISFLTPQTPSKEVHSIAQNTSKSTYVRCVINLIGSIDKNDTISTQMNGALD